MTTSTRVRGDRVSELRDRYELSQSDVAKSLNSDYGLKVEQSMVSHIETGRKQPSIGVLVAIAKLFNTSVDYLVGLKDDDQPSAGWEDEAIVSVKNENVKSAIREIAIVLNQVEDSELLFVLSVIRRLTSGSKSEKIPSR